MSSDGGNFEEAAGWRKSKRSEVSYEETILFKDARRVKALTVVMKAPMPFGLHDASLLTEGDEAFMIVSGAAPRAGEQCLAVSGSALSIQSCLDSIAVGDGRDVFRFQGDELLHVSSGMCVALAHGDGSQVTLQDCALAARAQDGRASWELAGDAQLKLARMGNYCLSALSGSVVARDCGEAGAGGDSSDQFGLDVLPELDLFARCGER